MMRGLVFAAFLAGYYFGEAVAGRLLRPYAAEVLVVHEPAHTGPRVCSSCRSRP